MTDCELLEMAAKAAGIEGAWQDGWFPGIVGPGIGDIDVPWNPLNNDGQAFRLSVKLRLISELQDCIEKYITSEQFDADPYAATRRAIVRAAAEIGKAMTQGDTQ